MSGPRVIGDTLPSPSEHNDHDLCPAKWWLSWREGWESTKTSPALFMGRLLDTALDGWYTSDTWDALTVFDKAATTMFERRADMLAEEWDTWTASARGALACYISTYPKLMPDEEKIVAIQPKITEPVIARPDMVILRKDGMLRIRDRKMISGAADLEWEKLAAEMAWQFIAYSFGVATAYGKGAPNEIEIDWLVRGNPPRRGKKAEPPSVERHHIQMEEHKWQMYGRSAVGANEEMSRLEGEITASTRYPLNLIPRRTMNCVKKFGNRSYPCDFYAACQMNVHPVDQPDNYRLKFPPKEVSDGSDNTSTTGKCTK